MRAAGAVLLLPLAALAVEPVSVPELDVEANVRSMMEQARRAQAGPESAVQAVDDATPAPAVPDPAPAQAPVAPAPSASAPMAPTAGTPAPAHVPVPLKTITIRDLRGVQDIADELEAARQQAPKTR